MFSLPLLLTMYSGFTHAFEADHLLAVSNMVTGRKSVRSSVKDGIYWGLGHASTILFIGILMLVAKARIPGTFFSIFESVVGLALVFLGAWRLVRFWRKSGRTLPAERKTPMHTHANNGHSLAYGVGLLHGLAGSGLIILALMSKTSSAMQGLTYLAIFGGGCIAGMMMAATIFSIPFGKNIVQARYLQPVLILLSSLLCIAFGTKIFIQNVF